LVFHTNLFGISANSYTPKNNPVHKEGAANSYTAPAKRVLFASAGAGPTTMIFAIIVSLTNGLQEEFYRFLSILHPPFLLGLITGGAMIYWFTGASIQAVTTGAYRAVEFIKANIRLDGATKASVEDSKKVVEICTRYAQKGMFNIFLGVFFGTLAFAFAEPFFFIGYRRWTNARTGVVAVAVGRRFAALNGTAPWSTHMGDGNRATTAGNR
jgi:K(+)-stimulated pyrophosphate-energized sodium pump